MTSGSPDKNAVEMQIGAVDAFQDKPTFMPLWPHLYESVEDPKEVKAFFYCKEP